MIKSNTCIAVLRKKKTGKLIFAADKRLSMGNHVQVGPRPKVIKRNGMILAGSGNAYLCDILTELLPLPSDNNLSPFEYMHKILFNNVAGLLMEKALMDDAGALKFSSGASLLISYKSELFALDVDSDEGILINAVSTPMTLGCGGHYALAVLTALEGTKLSEKEQLKAALCTAAELSPGCDSNIDYVEE